MPYAIRAFVKEICVLQGIHKSALAFTCAYAGSQGQPEVNDWSPLFPQVFPDCAHICVHMCSLLGPQEYVRVFQPPRPAPPWSSS